MSPIGVFRKGFTLAEVLITLGIIGVVAALTLPSFMAMIQDHVRAERVKNIQQKLSKATDKMVSISSMNGYESTSAFISEFKNHLSLAKVCDSNHLADCWPTSTVVLDKKTGKVWEIAKTTSAKAFKMTNDDLHLYEDTVGIVTADGTAMILTYNEKCNIDENQPITWDINRSSTTACLAGIFDWNGASRPNTFGEDVVSFGVGGLGQSCAIEHNGICFTAPIIPTPLSYSECIAKKGELGLDYCSSGNDYFAGAVATCGGKQNLPNMSELQSLASELYVGKPKINLSYAKNGAYADRANPKLYYRFNSSSDMAKAIGLSPTIRLYSNEEFINGANGSKDYNGLAMTQDYLRVWPWNRTQTADKVYVICKQ